MLQDSPMYAYLPARDVARAREFYEGTLGLRPGKEIAGGVAYEFADKTACFLYPTENAGTSRASQAFWQVDDIESEVAELKGRGVKFEEYDMPNLKTRGGIATAGGARRGAQGWLRGRGERARAIGAACCRGDTGREGTGRSRRHQTGKLSLSATRENTSRTVISNGLPNPRESVFFLPLRAIETPYFTYFCL